MIPLLLGNHLMRLASVCGRDIRMFHRYSHSASRMDADSVHVLRPDTLDALESAVGRPGVKCRCEHANGKAVPPPSRPCS